MPLSQKLKSMYICWKVFFSCYRDAPSEKFKVHWLAFYAVHVISPNCTFFKALEHYVVYLYIGSITSSPWGESNISVHDSWYDTLCTKVRGHDLMHFDTIRCAMILLRRFQLLVILWKETIVKFQTDAWHSKYESIKQKNYE